MVTLLRDGFCVVLLKLLGPVHAHDTLPVDVLAPRFRVLPVQCGPSLVAVGFTGNGFTCTVVVSLVIQPSLVVMVTIYCPLWVAAVLLPVLVFCVLALKLLGPDHEKLTPAVEVPENNLTVSGSQMGLLLLMVRLAANPLMRMFCPLSKEVCAGLLLTTRMR